MNRNFILMSLAQLMFRFAQIFRKIDLIFRKLDSFRFHLIKLSDLSFEFFHLLIQSFFIFVNELWRALIQGLYLCLTEKIDTLMFFFSFRNFCYNY